MRRIEGTQSSKAGSRTGHSVAGAIPVDFRAVLFTAVAGCPLCWLRDRSGSLPVPMALHWAVKCAVLR
ncbi:CPBP family intramembrane glutamic endopeptidase [Streptomyces sp. NPDC005917]|uniref:CPBP family intramembrane glutamic endopeptidase n=1 Tax=unclassified Streptomyces TaxID=2593676 RepID=UPI0033E3FD4E